MKRVGNRIEPWGMPLLTDSREEQCPSTTAVTERATSLSCIAWEQAGLNQGLEDLGWEKEWGMYTSMPDTITSVILSPHWYHRSLRSGAATMQFQEVWKTPFTVEVLTKSIRQRRWYTRNPWQASVVYRHSHQHLLHSWIMRDDSSSVYRLCYEKCHHILK